MRKKVDGPEALYKKKTNWKKPVSLFSFVRQNLLVTHNAALLCAVWFLLLNTAFTTNARNLPLFFWALHTKQPRTAFAVTLVWWVHYYPRETNSDAVESMGFSYLFLQNSGSIMKSLGQPIILNLLETLSKMLPPRQILQSVVWILPEKEWGPKRLKPHARRLAGN